VARNPRQHRTCTRSFQSTTALYTLSIFDTNHKEMNSIKLDAKVQALKFSPDSSKLAIALEDKSARIWTVGRTSKETHRLGPNPNGETGPSPAPGGHTWIVASIDWHPQGTKVVTGSWDSTAIVWDVSSSKPKPNVVRTKVHIYFTPPSQAPPPSRRSLRPVSLFLFVIIGVQAHLGLFCRAAGRPAAARRLGR
jgi:WD40 repeat protein